jgi:hypothetical protein
MADPVPLAELYQPRPISIQRGREGGERLRGQLLGQVSPRYLLLAGSEEALLAPEDAIVVRTLQAGKAFGFATVVREVIEQPVRLYFVDLPQSVEAISLRKAERLELFVPADVRYATGKGEGTETVLAKGNLVDVSGGGCRLFTKRGIAAGQVLNVSFILPGERHECVVSGSVIDSFNQGALFGQRIKWFANEKNLEDLTLIKRWVQQHLDFADVT